ncbi:hypothetical protein NLU13_2241 [Sarocladium strictum]|uniref:Uncharacterized protein n=1 Tax=Sarocladium strictum TaxID=5046 RepID=A0AA39LCH8_SARSR|nr:hypothetical protein NLU13_2241 [Sarocladium strictum]
MASGHLGVKTTGFSWDPARFKVAAVRYPPQNCAYPIAENRTWVDLDLNGTIERAIEFIDQAGAERVKFMGFPELYFPGFPIALNYNFTPANFTQYASRSMVQDGFKWDGTSCLVDYRGLFDLANNYYGSARRRLGTVKNEVLEAQCWFLCGVYEMYSLRPFQATKDFSHASSVLNQRLTRRRRDTKARQEMHVGQDEIRLYWSCWKPENDLRAELPVSDSILSRIPRHAAAANALAGDGLAAVP